MNKIIITGNLGQDAEEKQFPGGDKYWVLNVATTERWKDKEGNKQEKTTWHRCQLTGKYDNLIPYLRKGQQIAVIGTQRHEKYEFKDRTTNSPVMYDNKPINMSMAFIKVESVELLGGPRNDNQQQAASTTQAGAAQPQAAQAGAAQTTTQQPPPDIPVQDDLPF